MSETLGYSGPFRLVVACLFTCSRAGPDDSSTVTSPGPLLSWSQFSLSPYSFWSLLTDRSNKSSFSLSSETGNDRDLGFPGVVSGCSGRYGNPGLNLPSPVLVRTIHPYQQNSRTTIVTGETHLVSLPSDVSYPTDINEIDRVSSVRLVSGSFQYVPFPTRSSRVPTLDLVPTPDPPVLYSSLDRFPSNVLRLYWIYTSPSVIIGPSVIIIIKPEPTKVLFPLTPTLLTPLPTRKGLFLGRVDGLG